MNRRRYLVAVGATLFAGCSSSNDGATSTETATPTDASTNTPTARSTSTETSTSTEAPTETPTEPSTPEATPTAFEAALVDTEDALQEMYDAYLSQSPGAERLPEVDASTTEFDHTEVWDQTDPVNEGIERVREAASGSQRDTVDSLQAVRRFLYESARMQSNLVAKYDAVDEIRDGTEEDDAADVEEAYDAVTINPFPPTLKSVFRDVQDTGSSADASSIRFMSSLEWEQKIDQFDSEIQTVEGLETALERLPDAVSAMATASDPRADQETASNEAADAASTFGTVREELDGLLDEGVAESFVGVLEDLEELCRTKRTDAVSIQEST